MFNNAGYDGAEDVDKIKNKQELDLKRHSIIPNM